MLKRASRYSAVQNYPQPVGANDVHQDAEIG